MALTYKRMPPMSKLPVRHLEFAQRNFLGCCSSFSNMLAKIIILSVAVAACFAQHYGAPAGYAKPEEVKYPPQPYNFGYDSNDDYGTTSFRKESGDENGRVRGSYGYKDAQGIERVVEYVADEHGYRAEIKTNEPGTENKSPADIQLYANPILVNYVPQAQQYQQAQKYRQQY